MVMMRSASRVLVEDAPDFAAEDLQSFVARERAGIESALRAALPVSSLAGAERLNEALDYAVFPGGKRLRPALALLASGLAGASRVQGLGVACAVEFIHTSSLILDDLPAMDDADLRRSRRALHLIYGEGVAVLASVALLNQAYTLLAEAAAGGSRPGMARALVAEAARCIGAEGMVGGQAGDLTAQTDRPAAHALACRDLKTVALMRLMMTAGALARGARAADTHALADFGDCFGRAYQICDDLLDHLAQPAATGKPAGQDARHARPTSVSAYGVAGARRHAALLVERGVARLTGRFGARVEVRLLAEAATSVLARAGCAGSGAD